MDQREKRLHGRKNSATRETSISRARTMEKIADYWDSHSLADHRDETREAEFEVRALRRHRVSRSQDR